MIFQSGIHDFHCLYIDRDRNNKHRHCNKAAAKAHWNALIYENFADEKNCLSKLSSVHPCSHLTSSPILMQIASDYANIFRKRMGPVDFFFKASLKKFPNLNIYVKPNIIAPCGWNSEQSGIFWVRRDIQSIFMALINEEWKNFCNGNSLCTYIDIDIASLNCFDGSRDGLHFMNRLDCEHPITKSLMSITDQIMQKLHC